MILIRVIVGVVFLTEGVLKFVHPAELGSGRFAHIGLPLPHVLAPIVGAILFPVVRAVEHVLGVVVVHLSVESKGR